LWCQAIFDYIDRIFSIVRPRKLIYLAVDGPAPRAKMNQQRSRRFRAAEETAEKREMLARKRAELEAQGRDLPVPKAGQSGFDSNCITPGTTFMARLAEYLEYYVLERLASEPAWKPLTVILSDATAPGEGEHKIMSFIRQQRAAPGHDPALRHVLYGADADLIMLG
jgi:5'-3' exoribonuclease 2